MAAAHLEGSPPRSLPPLLADAAATLVAFANQTSLDHDDSQRAASSAQTIANGLQTRDLRTIIARETHLVASVGTLMANSLGGAQVGFKMELCRVVGNACFEHDENRQLVLDAGIPLLISRIIDSVMDPHALGSACSGVGHRRTLTLAELRMLRACTGAILNSSLKFDPMRKEVGREAILRSLLSLVDNRPESNSARPVYYVGMHQERISEDASNWEERLALGETIAGWTMNVLEDVLAEDNSRFPSAEGIPILASVLLSVPITRSTLSAPSKESLSSLTEVSLSTSANQDEEDDEDSHLDTCIELLSISAALLEGLTLDHDVHKQTISLSTYADSSPRPRSSLLYRLLEFVEFASPPEGWAHDEQERKRLEKTFEVVKAATVRAVVEGTNDDRVMHELWKPHAEDAGRNWLVEKLVEWLEGQATARSELGTREDLVVCASHMLAGLGRSDEYVEKLVQEYELVAPLAKIIEARVPAALVPAPSTTGGGEQPGASRAGENTQVLYGAVSLMRHLAIPLKNRSIISATHLIPTLSQLLSPSLDIVKPLQMSVIGLFKHLTSLNVSSSLDVLATQENPNGATPGGGDQPTTPIDLILALIKRTDEVQLRSESTRVLVNLVRSLFTNSTSSDQEAVRVARELVLGNEGIVEAISDQIRLSDPYPILVNEGIVALSLLSGRVGGERGASIVLTALTRRKASSISSETPAVQEEGEGSIGEMNALAPAPAPEPTASPGEPSTPLRVLLRYLESASASASATVAATGTSTGGGGGRASGPRPEIISNVCTLLITVLKNSGSDRTENKKKLCDELRTTVRDNNARGEGSADQSGSEWNAVREGLEVLGRVIEETV